MYLMILKDWLNINSNIVFIKTELWKLFLRGLLESYRNAKSKFFLLTYVIHKESLNNTNVIQRIFVVTTTHRMK